MNRDDLIRRIARSADPLKALARAQSQQRRADRKAAKQAGVSETRARRLRLDQAITAAFEKMSEKVRGR